MGLHESYNSEHSQVLMQDSLPDMEKAFPMVYVVENQREVHSDLEDSSNHMACQLALKSNNKEDDKFPQQKKVFVDKKNMICTHCRRPGHSQETCFQLQGVPDWYKTLNDKEKKGKHFTANVEGKGEISIAGSSQNVTEMMSALFRL
ncbi:UNVERIFIED_CONTAM: hypothetical protein Slati_2140800 [Sesamum latifolium]|uniref:Uncharacterized protein n=1 Tax=Sesamum latifolium TaxID=2727402 RepID=A0AAW2WTY0_9LAMI